MVTRADPDFKSLLAGALDWWREAGVDRGYEDAPRQWLADAEADTATPDAPVRKSEPQRKAHSPPEAPEPVKGGFDKRSLPNSLDAFASWWLSEPALCEGATSARVPPRGSAGAELMVIVPEPEREDSDLLLSGPQGRLLDSMLSAMGIEANRTYRASVLPRFLPGADWDEIGAGRLGEVLAHHVWLVSPKRLIVLGSNILPLMQNDPPQHPADLRIFNHEGRSTEMLACRSLAALLERPRWQARVWQAWLDWSG